MDKKNKHIEQLTPELIQAYHSGTLTSSEMHQVELLMLESPLYNEGIDGIEALSPEDLSFDIVALSTRVDEATSEEKIGFWTVWKKAAAVILVLITVSGLIYLNQPDQLPTKQLSALEKEPEKTSSDSTTKSLDSEQEPQEDNEIEKSPITTITSQDNASPSSLDEELVTENKQSITKPNDELTREPIILNALPIPQSLALSKPSDSLMNTSIRLKLEERTEGIQTLARSQSAKRKLENDIVANSFSADSQTDALATTTVTGKVIDSDDGLPLPQVTIFHKGTTVGKRTNLKGEFNFESLKPSTTLVFSYLGYITQEVKVGNKREIIVKMAPDATSLGEVVVTGVAAATPEKKLPFTITTIEGGAIDGSRTKTNQGNTESSTKAKPVDGFPKFNRYLKRNLRYPEAAKAQKIKGRVTVEFQISSTGELSNFKTIKGLGYGCDEEAIRLIKEGPKWNPKTKGSDKTPTFSTVTVKVRFR